jgi:hypothetical protein
MATEYSFNYPGGKGRLSIWSSDAPADAAGVKAAFDNGTLVLGPASDGKGTIYKVTQNATGQDQQTSSGTYSVESDGTDSSGNIMVTTVAALPKD